MDDNMFTSRLAIKDLQQCTPLKINTGDVSSKKKPQTPGFEVRRYALVWYTGTSLVGLKSHRHFFLADCHTGIENHWNCCVQIRFLGAKYAKKSVCSRGSPRLSLQCFPTPLAEFKRPTAKGRGGDERRGEGMEEKRRDGKGDGGREEEGSRGEGKGKVKGNERYRGEMGRRKEKWEGKGSYWYFFFKPWWAHKKPVPLTEQWILADSVHTVVDDGPVVEKAFEVLKQCVFVLVNESVHTVGHLTGVVQHTEVTTELQRLLWRIVLHTQSPLGLRRSLTYNTSHLCSQQANCCCTAWTSGADCRHTISPVSPAQAYLFHDQKVVPECLLLTQITLPWRADEKMSIAKSLRYYLSAVTKFFNTW